MGPAPERAGRLRGLGTLQWGLLPREQEAGTAREAGRNQAYFNGHRKTPERAESNKNEGDGTAGHPTRISATRDPGWQRQRCENLR